MKLTKNFFKRLFAKKSTKTKHKHHFYCPYCGCSWEADEDISFCPRCATPIQAKDAK